MIFAKTVILPVHFFSIIFCFSIMGCNTPSESESKLISKERKKVLLGKKLETESSTKHILFLGNSLTAAYGLDMEEGYVNLIQEKIDSLNFNYTTINGGLSGETSAGGLTRIDWMLKNSPTDIFVLALGGNDGLRGIDPQSTKSNLLKIIKKVRFKAPSAKIVIVGMEAPPNMGQDYTTAFRNIFEEIALLEKASIIPFLLKDVGGISELNQKDGIHPTAEGHKILAKTVWEVLHPLVKS